MQVLDLTGNEICGEPPHPATPTRTLTLTQPFLCSLIEKTNITQDPGQDSRRAPHSGREDTTRRTGTEAAGGRWGAGCGGEGLGVVPWRGERAGQVCYLRRGAIGPTGVRELNFACAGSSVDSPHFRRKISRFIASFVKRTYCGSFLNNQLYLRQTIAQSSCFSGRYRSCLWAFSGGGGAAMGVLSIVCGCGGGGGGEDEVGDGGDSSSFATRACGAHRPHDLGQCRHTLCSRKAAKL